MLRFVKKLTFNSFDQEPLLYALLDIYEAVFRRKFFECAENSRNMANGTELAFKILKELFLMVLSLS